MKLPHCLKKYSAQISSVSDERGMGEGYWVSLKDGWGVPGDPGNHTIHEDTPEECARYFPAVRCECCPACKEAA